GPWGEYGPNARTCVAALGRMRFAPTNPHPPTSWPDLFRPSTCSFVAAKEHVDAPDTPGHDDAGASSGAIPPTHPRAVMVGLVPGRRMTTLGRVPEPYPLYTLEPSWPDLFRPSTCSSSSDKKTWMPRTSRGMTTLGRVPEPYP